MSHTNHRRPNPPTKRRTALKGRWRRASLGMSTEARRDAVIRAKRKRRVYRTLRRRSRQALDVESRTERKPKPRTGKSWRWPSALRRPD